MDEYLREHSKHSSGTMSEVAEKIRLRLGIEIGYHVVPKSREHLLQYQEKAENLPSRSMKDGYTTALVPLSAGDIVRERYINHKGRLRLGRVMEDMDMFAVWICHRHLVLPNLPKDVSLPYTFVTLLVDRVDFSNVQDLDINKDIEFSGFTSWVGRSSIEITIFVRQFQNDQYLPVTKAIFLMVARNAINTGSAPVNKLVPADDMEKKCLKEAEMRQKRRRTSMSNSVFISPPLEHEQAIMYNIQSITARSTFELNKRALPPNCRWLMDSKRTTMMNSFPENRNSHNTIFGGFLMRQAVEIGYVTASIYINGIPNLKCISDISFLKPVRVTNLLEMSAYVVFTEKNYMQVMIVARNIDVNEGLNTLTNIFYCTYESNSMVDEILPNSYREMLWYIQGRRKFIAALNLELDLPKNDSPDTSEGKTESISGGK